MALFSKPILTSFSTQTDFKSEVVTIDNQKAIVYYQEDLSSEEINQEIPTNEAQETLKARNAERIRQTEPKRNPNLDSTDDQNESDPKPGGTFHVSQYKMELNSEEPHPTKEPQLKPISTPQKPENITYIKDTMEELKTGESGRTMIKVHGQNGETMLIDKGKHRIVETSNTEIQTEKEYTLTKVEPKQSNTDIDHDSDEILDDSSDHGEEEQDEDELFGGKLQPKEETKDVRQSKLDVVDEEDDEEASTFKSKLKEETKEPQNQKQHDETSNKIKSILEKQVRMSQLGGRGQSFLRDKSIIDKISKIRNFDFLALRSKDNKYYKRVTKILERYNEMPIGITDGME